MMISGSLPSVSSVHPPSGTDNPRGLEEAQLEVLADLKARDREVRAHETAHQAVGGQYAGSISYVYERGPDGAQYAVGGEVSIDTSPVQGDPQATIEKMRVVRAAALAPAEPSAQDRAVAAEAMQLMLQAQAELSSELGETQSSDPADSTDSTEPAAGESRSAANAYQLVSDFGETGTANDKSAPRFMAIA
ncbi:MAG: putative metalloprotease CJM1_0395 family protein [Marinobacter sp.]|uniref:putative metalloprotease CJM1_0395 family protein n=1 Tax=Marinobacter sp. TaxID=50741 RepID=UPI00329A1CAC